MAINNITQTISTLPPAGSRGVDVQTQFVIKQEDFQDHLQGITVTELNTLKDQLNSRIGEINSTTTTMNGYANTASAGASTATTKAGEASTSALDALSYKNQAETFKNNASTSATKAGQWADNNYNVEVEAGRYSAKHWSTVAQNTVSNKIDKVASTDNAVVRFNGVTGDVQNSGVVIDDTNNVGIGGTPDSKLSIFGTAGTNPYAHIKDANGADLYLQAVGNSDVRVGSASNHNLLLMTNGTAKATLDSAGNIGIGVTPSAWSGCNPIQLGNSCGIYGFSNSNTLVVSANSTWNGTNDIYRYSSNAASKYYQNVGTHAWQTAPSGTAGNPIPWNTAMTLGANGNLLVGTTTDNGVDKLQVNGSISSGSIQTITNGDLNDYKTRTQVIGTYTAMSNIPINDHGYLEVIVYSPGVWVMQRFTTLGVVSAPGRIFVRCLANSVWSAWVEK